MRVAVDGKLAEALEPTGCQRIIGKQAQRSCKDVGLPTILFSLGVAAVARRYRAGKLVVAFCLQQFIDVVALCLGEFVPLEERGIGHTHGPEARLPSEIARRHRAPVVVARAHFQLVRLMGAISKNQRFHRHFFDIAPRYTRGQRHLSLTIFHEECTDHREVGIRTYATLVVGHRVLALETSTCLAYAVRSRGLLEVVLHVLGEVGKHLQQVLLHGGFTDKVGRDDTLGGTGLRSGCQSQAESRCKEKEFLHCCSCLSRFSRYSRRSRCSRLLREKKRLPAHVGSREPSLSLDDYFTMIFMALPLRTTTFRPRCSLLVRTPLTV